MQVSGPDGQQGPSASVACSSHGDEEAEPSRELRTMGRRRTGRRPPLSTVLRSGSLGRGVQDGVSPSALPRGGVCL